MENRPTTECISIYGNTVTIPTSQLVFRPGVYAIIVYIHPYDKVYHSFLFFYVCFPKTFELLPDDSVDDDDAEQPRWIDIQRLHADDFQNHGTLILRLLSSRNT